MKRKRCFRFFCTAFFLLVFALLCFGRAFPSRIKSELIRVQNTMGLHMDEALFYRQTLNNCGPYAVMGILNILKNQTHNPETLAAETTWRMHKNLTFPQGVINLLHKYRVNTKEFILKNKSDNEKIDWIKKTLPCGRPIVVLIKVNHIQHYVTIIGYDENGLMAYDSLQEKRKDNPRQTVTDNSMYAGNGYYTNEEFLALWNKGGYKIFFRNWALACF